MSNLQQNNNRFTNEHYEAVIAHININAAHVRLEFELKYHHIMQLHWTFIYTSANNVHH